MTFSKHCPHNIYRTKFLVGGNTGENGSTRSIISRFITKYILVSFKDGALKIMIHKTVLAINLNI